jgi:hypothetical protein
MESAVSVSERIAKLEARREAVESELDDIDSELYELYGKEREEDLARPPDVLAQERAKFEARLAEVRAGRW